MGAQGDAQEAVFTAITKVVKELEESGYDPTTRATSLEKLALAYRYLSGGSQPGASVIPS